VYRLSYSNQVFQDSIAWEETAMTALSQDQRERLRESGGGPLRLVDPDTKKEYVLLQADMYEQMLASIDENNPRVLYPALQRALKDEGWDDPQMDEYNRYG
jgi:hypothetical protein